MSLSKKNTFLIIRLLVAITFIVSAISKLLSIDAFEVYVYSFGLLSLNTAFLFARAIIGLELFLGISLIGGFYLRRIIQTSLLMLLSFSAFIVYLILSNNSEHCHCFGALLEMSHWYSLAKNILLIILLSIIYKNDRKKLKYELYLTLSLFAVSGSLPFIISPPDSFYYEVYSKKISYNDEMLNTYLDENPKYKEGKKMLCFFSTACRFCKLSTRKITVISNQLGHSDMIHCVFWGDKSSIEKFYKKNNSIAFDNATLDPNRFLKITNGEMPLIVLLENGVVKSKYAYRNINDDEIIQFFKNE